MLQRQTGPVAKLLAAVLLATLVAACTAPVPKPAMVPLGQTGDFGYSERDVGTDKIEVTYTGSNIRVSSSQGRADSRLVTHQPHHQTGTLARDIDATADECCDASRHTAHPR